MSQGIDVPGVCRYCGCTEDNACRLETGGGETCSWLNRERTVCNARPCVIRFHADDLEARCRAYRKACKPVRHEPKKHVA